MYRCAAFAVVGASQTVCLVGASLLSLIRILAAVYIGCIDAAGVNEQEQDETVAQLATKQVL